MRERRGRTRVEAGGWGREREEGSEGGRERERGEEAPGLRLDASDTSVRLSSALDSVESSGL